MVYDRGVAPPHPLALLSPTFTIYWLKPSIGGTHPQNEMLCLLQPFLIMTHRSQDIRDLKFAGNLELSVSTLLVWVVHIYQEGNQRQTSWLN
ncbi:hypothetical protein ES332_D05G057300v1 [Gossypium tomentosum]|uniref:Uncharacterized protein n=1 Tax=Gossypium tomentosum TaxID=34277 RepID=A0A5D2KQS3_GOSTO|nr:hypothetical protein ES332_D05G057300v1 [Gossypium tomentosum]